MKNWIVPVAFGSETVAISLCVSPASRVPTNSTDVVVATRAPCVGVALATTPFAERAATFSARTLTVYSVPAVRPSNDADVPVTNLGEPGAWAPAGSLTSTKYRAAFVAALKATSSAPGLAAAVTPSTTAGRAIGSPSVTYCA